VINVPTRNINLTDHFDRFVNKQVEAGTFSNASEVMRAGLRLLEQQTREDSQKLTLLRSLASEAFQQLDQGRGISIRDEEQLAGVIGRVGRRAARAAERRARGARAHRAIPDRSGCCAGYRVDSLLDKRGIRGEGQAAI